MKVKSESEVAQSCPTPRDLMDCSPPESMGFSRQEYWSGLPSPVPAIYGHKYYILFLSDTLLNPGSVTQCWLHVRLHLRHLKSLLRMGSNLYQLNQESLEVISAHHYFKKLASGF